MSQNNLYKGFEVELFTGSLNSHIGVSADIEKKFSDFVKEPDNRNVEYITCLLYTSPSPRDPKSSRMPSSA